MPLRLLCYTDPEDGSDVIREWYDARDTETRAQIDGVLLLLTENDHARRDEHSFKALERRSTSRRCLGLHEILIDFGRHHYRVLGYLDGDKFIMLYPFYKSNTKFDRYSGPCRESQNRLEKIRSGRATSKHCEFPPPP
jgi:hypothetical protein